MFKSGVEEQYVFLFFFFLGKKHGGNQYAQPSSEGPIENTGESKMA